MKWNDTPEVVGYIAVMKENFCLEKYFKES